MMKKFLPIFLLVLCVLDLSGEPEAPGKVYISFDLHKIPRIASNQVAVWVETDRGVYIDTVYVSRFTAKGGYKKRTDALPEWVDTVTWAELKPRHIDALSSPTRGTGLIELEWDCRDASGIPVPEGDYVVLIEGNIFWANRVIWKCSFEVGPRRDRAKEEVFFIPGEAAEMEPLIENAAVTFEP